jgi:hypothetical protein
MRCRVLLAALLLASLCACGTPVGSVSSEEAGRKLGFLRDGETTRREVIERLGEPLAVHTFDRDAMLAYRLFENELGRFSTAWPPRSRGREYEVVLQFDDRGVLRRHALVAKQ